MLYKMHHQFKFEWKALLLFQHIQISDLFKLDNVLLARLNTEVSFRSLSKEL